MGREYNFGPQNIGECKVVNEGSNAAGGAKDGQIIFMQVGPVNLMPFIDEYELRN